MTDVRVRGHADTRTRGQSGGSVGGEQQVGEVATGGVVGGEVAQQQVVEAGAGVYRPVQGSPLN